MIDIEDKIAKTIPNRTSRLGFELAEHDDDNSVTEVWGNPSSVASRG